MDPEGYPVLYVVDTGTNFPAAQFVSIADTCSIWNMLVTI